MRRPSVRAHAHFVTQREGGKGAVRELCELILAAQGASLHRRRTCVSAAR